MKINPRELTEQGYVLKEELDHQELMSFIQKCFKEKTIISGLYNWINLGFLFCLLALFLYNCIEQKEPLGDGILCLAYGIAIAFLLIPLHEYIHVLAYRYVGAKDTSYDYNLKQFYFMAIADKFVISYEEFKIVALAPFLAVFLLGILMLPFISIAWWYFPLGMVLTHSAFCSGDFGLLNYFEQHKDQELVSYDDKTNKLSYFFVKEKMD